MERPKPGLRLAVLPPLRRRRCRKTLRSRIEPIEEDAQSLRQHGELVFNYFRAHKLTSSGVEGLNATKVTMRESYGIESSGCWNWPFMTNLASCPRQNQPTIFGIDR